MKKTLAILLVLFVGTTVVAQKKKDLIKQVETLKSQKAEIQKKLSQMQKAQEVNLDDEVQNFSYAMGVSMGNNLKESGVDSLSNSALVKGLEDVIKGTEKISAEKATEMVKTTMNRLEEAKNDKLKKEGETYLVNNAKRPEIITTASGLQYEVLTKADGAKPIETDKVKVHYAGSFLDGTEFDSSIARGEPVVFGVNQVIKGWTEALKLMPVGSKWKLYIPHELGYGARGAGNGAIPPYSTLIFHVELLSIE